MRFLNLELLKNPYNWFAVAMMVLVGLFLVALLSPEE